VSDWLPRKTDNSIIEFPTLADAEDAIRRLDGLDLNGARVQLEIVPVGIIHRSSADRTRKERPISGTTVAHPLVIIGMTEVVIIEEVETAETAETIDTLLGTMIDLLDGTMTETAVRMIVHLVGITTVTAVRLGEETMTVTGTTTEGQVQMPGAAQGMMPEEWVEMM
jgi:hypothetical protein